MIALLVGSLIGSVLWTPVVPWVFKSLEVSKRSGGIIPPVSTRKPCVALAFCHPSVQRPRSNCRTTGLALGFM
jgi:hypothetical protein